MHQMKHGVGLATVGTPGGMSRSVRTDRTFSGRDAALLRRCLLL
jgi:hypothetical protein